MKKYEHRKYVIIAIIILSLLAVYAKVFHLQVIDVKYKISSENNSQRRVVQYPGRGLIYDRNDVLMVSNEAAYDLMVIPGRVREFDTIALANKLGLTTDGVAERLNRARQYSFFRPSLFYRQMSSRQYAEFQEYLYKYHGFFVQNRTLRRYRHGVGAHLLGDVGEVNRQHIEQDSYYRMGDYIGRSGIEQTYERYLRGKKGVQIFLVDVHNRIQGSYMDGALDTTAVPGKNVQLTIDVEIQKYAEKLMRNKKGAIVAIQPRTGEILCLVSSPTFDPQVLVGRQRGYYFDSLKNCENKPLFNRAVSAVYPPGSVFKLANALVALEVGTVNANSYIPCNQYRVRCHSHPRADNLAKSVQYSCNPYYYFAIRDVVQQGKETSIFRDSHLGLKHWKDLTVSLGFETAHRIGISGVNRGFMPGTDYYDRLYGKFRWAYSTIYSLSIGQGEVMTSTLQLANLSAVIANKGYYYTPHLVKSIDNKQYNKNVEKHYSKIQTEHFYPVIEGMHAAVNIPGGTGFFFANIPDIPICGKTGTVQNPHGENHSVFTAFAPKDNPEIAIAVYIENAGYGGVWAAPTASLVIEKYLTREVNNKLREQRIMEASFIIENNKQDD